MLISRTYSNWYLLEITLKMVFIFHPKESTAAEAADQDEPEESAAAEKEEEEGQQRLEQGPPKAPAKVRRWAKWRFLGDNLFF